MSDTFKPTAAVAKEAQKAIDLRKDGHRGGTDVGWKRASQLANRTPVTLDIIKRMVSYFARHAVDKKGKDWNNKEKPSKGRVSWLLWGGDAGRSWAKSILRAHVKNVETAKVKPLITRNFSKTTENFDNSKPEPEYNPCWEGYEMFGYKTLDGKKVPNCVPIKTEKREKPVTATYSDTHAQLKPVEDLSSDVMSQKEMINLLKSTKLTKYKKIGTAQLRAGVRGEKIETFINKKLETISYFGLNSGAVVKGSKGEEYIIPSDKLSRYLIDKPLTNKYQKFKVADVYCWAVKCPKSITFIAKWNEKMIAKKGDMLASPDASLTEVYRIEKSVFSKTYKKV